jgi:hypothetical protein
LPSKRSLTLLASNLLFSFRISWRIVLSNLRFHRRGCY